VFYVIMPKTTKTTKTTKKQTGGKSRPLNLYFQTMLKAKKSGDQSFMYKGNKYIGRKHDKLGMVYKKQ